MGNSNIIEVTGSYVPDSDVTTFSIDLPRLTNSMIPFVFVVRANIDASSVDESYKLTAFPSTLLEIVGGMNVSSFSKAVRYIDYIIAPSIESSVNRVYVVPYHCSKYTDSNGVFYNQGKTNANSGGVVWENAQQLHWQQKFMKFKSTDANVYFKQGLRYDYVILLKKIPE